MVIQCMAVLSKMRWVVANKGIQFQWEGNHKYPDDYPDLGTEITVVGTFSYQKVWKHRFLIIKECRNEGGLIAHLFVLRYYFI